MEPTPPEQASPGVVFVGDSRDADAGDGRGGGSTVIGIRSRSGSRWPGSPSDRPFRRRTG